MKGIKILRGSTLLFAVSLVGSLAGATGAANMPATAPAAPDGSLSVSPASIKKGESATLHWSASNATRCEIQPGVGAVPPQGSMAVLPDGGTTYTLTCKGPGGKATATADLAVASPQAPAARRCRPTVINIRFDKNRYDIKPEYRGELKELADFLTEFPKATGTIEGHTDSAGIKSANMRLSRQRAESVRKYLIEKFGIAAERIKAVGYGPTKPVADNRTKAGKERNRRIESNFRCED